MWFERIVAEGLSQNTYLVGSGGKAAVIDPRRDCDPCLDSAGTGTSLLSLIFSKRTGTRITCRVRWNSAPVQRRRYTMDPEWTLHTGTRYVKATGLRLERWNFLFLKHLGTRKRASRLSLQTPKCQVNRTWSFPAIPFFSGDIARTDFFGSARKAEMAEKIYDSITKKILPLGDGVILCPAHGAGSACGSEIADHPFSTLGYEKRTNPFLLIKKDAFVARRTTESPYLPPYLSGRWRLSTKTGRSS